MKTLALALMLPALGGEAVQSISGVVSLKQGGYALRDANGRTLARSASIPARAPDGRVAVAVRDGAGYRIEIGGRTVARLAGPDLPALAFSSDGSTLAVAGFGGVQLVTGGTVRKLALPAGRYGSLAFSPDGTQLAFVQTTGDGRAGTLRSQLRIAPVAGGPARTLHKVADPYNSLPRPVFTPDGVRIAFVLGYDRLVTVPAAGGALEEVTQPQPHVTISNVVALADGFAFGRTPDRGVTDVWRVDSAGTLSRLTVTGIPPRGEPHYGTFPLALSPDGTQLLVARRTSLMTLSFRGNRVDPVRELGSQPLAGFWLVQTRARIVSVSATSELVVRGPDGRAVQLTHDRVHDGLPSWSPDGRRIAFIRAPYGTADIYVANADGTGVQPLAGGALRGSDELYPAWSPDAQLIAFSSYRNGRGDVYVMRSDGTGVRRLTSARGGEDNFQPRFSPDGRFVVFASSRGIVRMPVAGGSQTVLAESGLMPEYSPSGARIAFVREQAVWTMSANGGDVRPLVRHAGYELAYPRYSPDGTTILYSRYRAAETVDKYRLRTIRVDGTADTDIGAGAEADW